MRGHQPFHVPAQVVPLVRSTDNRCQRSATCTASGAPARAPARAPRFGIPAGPVSADHLHTLAYPPGRSRQILHTRVSAQPVGEDGGVPAQENIDRAVPVGQVDQHRAVLMAAAQRELVDAQNRHLADRWIRQAADQPEQRGPAHPIPSLLASRDPARPANANPTATNAPRRPELRRACRSVKPGTCSTNVQAPQSTSSQKNRRTSNTTSTGRPETGKSARCRRYRLCTRVDTRPHHRHRDPLARGCAVITTVLSTASIRSITTGDNCGSRTRQQHSPTTTPRAPRSADRAWRPRSRLGFTQSAPEPNNSAIHRPGSSEPARSPMPGQYGSHVAWSTFLVSMSRFRLRAPR